jgi:Flp pilus assembly protein TadG
MTMCNLSQLFRSQSGVVGMTTALVLPLLVGFAGLGIEATEWYTQARSVQAAADAAALSAAVAYAQGNTSAYSQEATSVASSNGYTKGVNGVTVTVNMPPASGSQAGNKNAVQVNIVEPITPLLSAMFISGFNVSGNGVAIVGGPSNSSNGCVLALNSAATTGANLNGATSVTLNKCAFDVNATSATASLVMNGGASLTAQNVNLGGGDQISNNSTLTATDGVKLFQPPASDPYASRQIPSFSGCYKTNLKVSKSIALQPGVYCGGIDITGGTVTLSPGVYILDQGDFNVNGNATVIASGGVTIILTTSKTDFSTVGNVIINGGATVNLVAPATGQTAGIAIWQDRRAPDSGKDKLNGGSTMQITGAIYLPSQSVTYAGGQASADSGCTQLIALNITFTGTSQLGNSCSGTGVTSITSSSSVAQLVQ